MAGAQSRRLSALVDDMLVLASADAGGIRFVRSTLYLDDVVDECRRAVDVLAAERGITVTSTGTTDVPLRGDEELLRRLMAQSAAERGAAHTAGRRGISRHQSERLSGVHSRDRQRRGYRRKPIRHASSTASCSSIRRGAPEAPGLG